METQDLNEAESQIFMNGTEREKRCVRHSMMKNCRVRVRTEIDLEPILFFKWFKVTLPIKHVLILFATEWDWICLLQSLRTLKCRKLLKKQKSVPCIQKLARTQHNSMAKYWRHFQMFRNLYTHYLCRSSNGDVDFLTSNQLTQHISLWESHEHRMFWDTKSLKNSPLWPSQISLCARPSHIQNVL